MQQKIILKKEPNYDPKLGAYRYQEEAVNALKNLNYGAVFHEQGLGKTKIAIDILLYWLKKKMIDTVIIVAKKTLVYNWKIELESHTKVVPSFITEKKSENYYTFNGRSRLVITHYEAIKTELRRFDLFCKTRNVAMILDESTKIKNPDSVITKAFFKISPLLKKKLILTGLPVSNRPYDLWSQIKFLDNGKSLGTNFIEFKNHVDLPKTGNSEELRNYSEFLSNLFPRIQKFTVRETKNSRVVTIKIPNKEFINIKCKWEAEQHDIYNNIKNKIPISILKDGIKQLDVSEDILKKLLRLVQTASNPFLLDKAYKKLPGKYLELQKILKKINENNEKAIIWTAFVDGVDWLYKGLENYQPVKIYGKMKIDDRNKSVKEFKENKNEKILIATPPSAKEGLTLTVANHVIFFDRSFSLDDYYQSQDRIHRISQKKTCYVYNLIMENSIDEWVELLLKVKYLSAKLSQGDITQDEFNNLIPLNFFELLKNLIND